MKNSSLKTKVFISGLYILAIVIVNLGFDRLPFIQTPLGVLPAMAFVVGLIFIFRDFAQRAVGHLNVIPLMLLGALITWFLVDKKLAVASVAAFLISEFVDWLVYTYTKKPFESRVLLSSAASTPLDSIVFLYLVGFLSGGSVLIMTASKMLVACLMWLAWKRWNVEQLIAKRKAQ